MSSRNSPCICVILIIYDISYSIYTYSICKLEYGLHYIGKGVELMEERTASDIMEKNFVTASPSTSVFSLVHMFVKNKVAAIPIVDEEEQLIGIITDADLLYKKIKPHVPHYVNLLGASIYYNGISEYDKGFKKLMACTAKEMMTKNVIIAAPDADVEQLAGVMVAEHLKVIPIVDGRRVVGIVTRYNILDELYKEYGTSEENK